MDGKYDRDYISKHEQISDKLKEIAKKSGIGCVSVTRIATELGMDQRTVRSHLKLIEVDKAGVFIGPEEKEFCTKEGIILLAKKLGILETAD